MNTDRAHLPMDILALIRSWIVIEVISVKRIVCDISTKLRATIEQEKDIINKINAFFDDAFFDEEI